jgi:hypothetical protein
LDDPSVVVDHKAYWVVVRSTAEAGYLTAIVNSATVSEFLRPVLLGETVAPFRLLTRALGVVPADRGALLDAAAAADTGHRHLAAWLRDIEAKWAANCAKRADGAPRMTLLRQLDHMRKLSTQLSATGLKVVYTKAEPF